jgi:transposase
MPSPHLHAIRTAAQATGQAARRQGLRHPRCRQALRRRHIQDRIAGKGIDSSQRLGHHRWVIERTLAWLNRYRRLTVRYERRADIHHAFLSLGCCLICFNTLQQGV